MNKRKIAVTVLIIVVIIGLIGFYLFDVFYSKTPYKENLLRVISTLCVLVATLIRVHRGTQRASLDFYEKFYEKEIGYAFKNKPLQKNKLLCACRLYNESNYRKALKYLFQLLKEAEFDRDMVSVLLFIALCYTDAGATEEAIKVYYDLLKIDSNNATAHSNIGHLHIKQGDFESALMHYNKSIEIKPDNYYAYSNRANYYFRTDDFDSAIEDAKKAIEIKNNGVEAASLLTIIYALRGDEENKKKYFHIAVTSGKSPEEINDAIKYYSEECFTPSEEDCDEEQVFD